MNNSISYWGSVKQTVKSLSIGLRLTFIHLVGIRKSRKSSVRLDIQDCDYFKNQKGISTIQFPHEQLPIPDTGRYQLHNEIDDCIVCDKCVKVCPVNCITIEPIRSPDEFGKTSDGTSRRIYAAKFDIDMGKCCYCGLCTTVCPTECLTMTPIFDFSSFSMDKHYFTFGKMTQQEILEKKDNWEKYQAAKQTTPQLTTPERSVAAKPAFKPKIILPKPPSEQ